MERHARRAILSGAVAIALLATVDVAAASNAAAGLSGERGEVTVPTWLYAVTGGGVIGASGLMSMLVTDRELLRRLHGRSVPLPLSASLPRLARLVGAGIGLLVLAVILFVGFTGPETGRVNLAVLLVFVGGRAGLTILAYLVGNPWPLLNPWRRLAAPLPTGIREYPDRLSTWPAVAGLFTLVWLELSLPVTGDPAVLATLVAAYTVYTLAGAVAFGEAAWFRHADPLSVWFRFYGTVAPIQRSPDGNGLAIRPYGGRLHEGEVLGDRADVAFAVLLVTELTFSGVVTTDPGVGVIQAGVDLGFPAALVYIVGLAGLYATFLGGFLLAARAARNWGQTFLSTRYLGRRFGSPLLAIAAGYHFAHYGGFYISLSPTLVDVAQAPFETVNASVAVLPTWFGHVQALAILLGHVLAVWVAHGIAIDTFPGRVQAIRSQYPFVLVMVGFTIASLWIISLATVSPV